MESLPRRKSPHREYLLVIIPRCIFFPVDNPAHARIAQRDAIIGSFNYAEQNGYLKVLIGQF